MYLDSENALYAIAAQNRIASYFDLKKNFGRWRQWLAAQGPILAGLLVDDSLSAAVTTQGKLDGSMPRPCANGDNERRLTLHPGEALRVVLHENAASG
jgi:hypothetical protein